MCNEELIRNYLSNFQLTLNTKIYKGDNMELKTKLFAILAIFCVLCSACAVCAADDIGSMSADDGIFIDGSSHDGHDGAIIPPDNTHDEARHAAGMDPYLDGSQDGHNGMKDTFIIMHF